MNPFRRYLAGDSGASAIEFGLVFPIIIFMMLGIVSFSMLGGALSGMHFAVEEAARCFAVNKTTCGSSSAAVTFAEASYLGPDVKPVFEATNAGCGYTVTGSATFEFSLAIMNMNIPLTASACYPGKAA